MNRIPKVSNMFPPHIRDALIAAAKRDENMPVAESRVRTVAVEGAIRRAQRECPHLFKHDKE